MEHHEELKGTIERVIYNNQENGFSIFVLQLNQHQSTIVKGFLPNINPGEQVVVQGAWVSHPKFGRQFDAKNCSAHVPTTVMGLKKYLGSGLIKGIGKVYADKLVNRFGVDTLEIINNEPDRLFEVPGIGKKRVEQIIAAWHDQKEIANIMVFLQDKGVSTTFATKIYKKYGHESIALLKENPYRLAEDIWGVGFKMADQVAQQLGFEKHSVKRISAGILFTITNATSIGHLYCELEELKTKTIELLELDADQTAQKIKIALHELYNAQKIKLLTHDNQHFVTLSKLYYTEKNVAAKINDLQKYQSNHLFNLQDMYTKVRTADGKILLNEQQQEGILACVQHKVTVITGGPGTGKTTLIKKLLSCLDDQRVKYKLAAPTGRAAKRMQEGTGRHAETIHRLLEFDVSTMGFTHNENNALKVDFLIIDEASMIDIFLANALLKALPLSAHIIFLGDIDQLPSVGPGNVLNDMIASQKINYVRLTEIFRQAQDSLIIVNAHKINQGEFPVSFLPEARRDFRFIKEEEPAEVQNHLKQIFGITLRKYGIKTENTTVLVPMNRGVVGTQNLNHQLQELLNPEDTPHKIMRAGTIYKPGDKVMQIRNNYDKLVFNGDIGTIEQINKEDQSMTVNYFDRLVTYESDELNELVLAYATSIHKSQGSEYDAVIIPIFMQHFMLLQRNLIYTAITRAKKLCIFIGQPKAIAMAIKNNKGIKRTTFLKEFLTTDLVAR